MTSDESVSYWLASLKAGEFAEAAKLWDRYQTRLTELASRRLATLRPAVADEQDVLQSVFYCLCQGAAAGRFADVRNRDELWWLLLNITRHKTIDLFRRETSLKRGGSMARLPFDQLVCDEPTPEFMAILEEEWHHFLDLLRDDQVRKIAVLRLEGYSISEIAEQLSISIRSVDRKLHLIRDKWTREQFHVGERADLS